MKRLTQVALATLLATIPAAASLHGDTGDRLSPLAKGYLERGLEMTSGGNATGAIDQLRHIATGHTVLDAAEQEEYAYLLAMAMYERDDRECVDLLREFTATYPASPAALSASLACADYFFFNGRYPQALTEYEEIDFARINPGDRPLYTYRMALCNIRTGHYDTARRMLATLRSEKEYAAAARYYTAYIDYIEGNWEEARRGFETCTRNPEKDMEPDYYIVQIDYTTGKWQEAARRGQALLQGDPVAPLLPQTLRVTGLSLFRLGDYDGAYRYLLRYLDSENDVPDSEALYALGAIEYSRGDSDAAEQYLERVANEDTPVGQGASLYLGQIAAERGNNSAAAISFDRAYRLGFDPKVSETALFNYVSARTHGGNIPFSSSIDLLEKFLTHYPYSEYAPAAREYLATAYYHEKDYSKALESIERIPHPSSKVLAAKQIVTFELGRQYMSAGDPGTALGYLQQSVALSSHDRQLGEQATLWLADAEYALGKYREARRDYTSYLSKATSSTNTTLARYNLAYTAYMLGDYSQAARQFASALKSRPALPATLSNDAMARMADCQYYTGDYRSATDSYSKVIAAGGSEADYATFRRAVMYGLGGNITGKLRELASMRERYPDSRWLPDAILESGLTYAALDQPSKAENEFQSLVRLYPDNPQTRKGLLNLAISYSEQGNGEMSARTYQSVIERWPSSEEARLANEDLRRWHAANGTLGDYSRFLNNIPDAPRLDAGEVERLEYEAAEEALDGRNPSTAKLEKYVADYPDGTYVARALASIAEEAYATGDMQKALDAYRNLATKGGQTFAAEAYAGIMRTTTDPQERITYARRTAAMGGVAADIKEEARFYEANGLAGTGNWTQAEEIYRSLASNPDTEAGARAAVTLGEELLARGETKRAEKILTDFTDGGTAHQYWLARGFITLADTYARQGKQSLALQYVRSLRDNYPGNEQDIQEMISDRIKRWK